MANVYAIIYRIYKISFYQKCILILLFTVNLTKFPGGIKKYEKI